MTTPAKQYTRGIGLLEPLLARLRARQANRLIPSSLRKGRILDIGCGSYPYFLSHTSFEEKFAIDQAPVPADAVAEHRIEYFSIDVNKQPILPFNNDYFHVVTLLAVVEHLDPMSLAILFSEVYRLLKPGGMLIMTTPAAWSVGILRMMVSLRLVSREEIEEHVYAYTLPLIGWYFGQAGFAMKKIRFGYFESMLNMWATAEK